MNVTSPVIGLVVEGPSDERTVSDLVQRMSGVTPSFRGLDERSPRLEWRGIDGEARRRVPRVHGRFGKVPVSDEDGPRACYALQCFVGRGPRPVAVVLVRDSDGKLDDRKQAIQAVCDDRKWPFEILIGMPHTMRECWVLTALGASDVDKNEAKALEKLRKNLGFDPTKRSEELPASAAKHNPKTTLEAIIGKNNKDREADLWGEADLEKLREHGAGNGLAAFMREIEAKLLPLLTGG